MDRLSWIIEGASDAITRVLRKERQRKLRHMVEGQCGHKARPWGLLEAIDTGRSRGWVLPLSLQREHSPTSTMMLAQWNWFQVSGLENYERIIFCCLKHPSLWRFLTTPIANECTRFDIFSCVCWPLFFFLCSKCLFVVSCLFSTMEFNFFSWIFQI